MQPVDAERFIYSIIQDTAGRWYGPAHARLALGAGVLYDRVRIPIYKLDERIFLTARLPVLVLTHECDIDEGNQKALNSDVLAVPLTPLEELVNLLSTTRDDSQVKAFIGDLANDRISQLVYLPSLPETFPLGAIVNMNRLCSTHVREFRLEDEVKRLGALTEFGLSRIDARLQNHLFREKADRLPLGQRS